MILHPLNEALKASSYVRLPTALYQLTHATPIKNPRYVWFNSNLANELSLSNATSSQEKMLSLLAGNTLPKELTSLALGYAGHQFGVYVPQLGDGRALMLGEITNAQKLTLDVQLKGSGPTAYSRGGDGRAPLAAALKEAIFSEAMHGLSIPSTRTLTVISGDECIIRDEGKVPIGVLTRMARGHLRFGSFQYAAAMNNPTYLKALSDFAIDKHFPKLKQSDAPYHAFLEAVIEKQAQLLAQWMGVGFIHGVMNTDNMSITGETIDYGPCAFMESFSWNQTFSSIDVQGRYAYGNQPNIAYFNCAQLAQALSRLFSEQPQNIQALHDILQSFSQRFNHHWQNTLMKKFGLQTINDADTTLIQTFFTLLEKHQADFTYSFYLLSHCATSKHKQSLLLKQLGNAQEGQTWIDQWIQRINQQKCSLNATSTDMQSVNPIYVPRLHIVDNAINQIIDMKKDSAFKTLMSLLQHPYCHQDEADFLLYPPNEKDKITQTFCGT